MIAFLGICCITGEKILRTFLKQSKMIRKIIIGVGIIGTFLFVKFYISHYGLAVLNHIWGIMNTWQNVLQKPYGHGLGTGGNAAQVLSSTAGDWLSSGGETALLSYIYQIGLQGGLAFILAVLSTKAKLPKEKTGKEQSIAYERPDHTWIEAGCFGAEKHDPFLKKCLDRYEGRHFVRKDNSLDVLPLPRVMDEVIRDNNLTVKAYPWTYFTAKSYETGVEAPTNDTYTIHHFAGSWKSSKEQEIYNKAVNLRKIPLIGNGVAFVYEKAAKSISINFPPVLTELIYNHYLQSKSFTTLPNASQNARLLLFIVLFEASISCCSIIFANSFTFSTTSIEPIRFSTSLQKYN